MRPPLASIAKRTPSSAESFASRPSGGRPSGPNREKSAGPLLGVRRQPVVRHNEASIRVSVGAQADTESRPIPPANRRSEGSQRPPSQRHASGQSRLGDVNQLCEP